MESQSTESEDVEKALKDLIDQWDTEDYEKAGQEFVKQVYLNCSRQSGTYIDQIKKRLKRDLTPEEERVLEFYYRFFCRKSIGQELTAPQLDRLKERIRQSKEGLQRVEQEFRRLLSYMSFSQTLELQSIDEELRRSIEELQSIDEELRETE